VSKFVNGFAFYPGAFIYISTYLSKILKRSHDIVARNTGLPPGSHKLSIYGKVAQKV